MSDQLIQQAFARIRAKAKAAVTVIGAESVAEIKQAIDIPIEYNVGGKTIRSSPGQPPRRGVKNPRLQNSIRHAVYEKPDAIGVSVGAGPVYDTNGEEYAAKVEQGGFSQMYKSDQKPRPYMRPAFDRLKAEGSLRIAAAMKSA
jgi:hypothetical protein